MGMQEGHLGIYTMYMYNVHVYSCVYNDTLLNLNCCFNPSGVASDAVYNNAIILFKFLTASPVHLVIAFCALNSFVIPLP